MNHYYFKFQIGNKGLETWKESGGNMGRIPLSIYFWDGKNDAYNSVVKTPEKYKLKNSQINQIKNFYSIAKNPIDTYFWIFYNHEVLCYKPMGSEVIDGPEILKVSEEDTKGSIKEYLPKSMDAELIYSLKKHTLPEIFANINSNRKYNRKTIAELSGSEKLIADSLINKNKIHISRKNYLNYLSPIEFETLIFLIFNHGGSICSSFRGGTLKDFDLKISLSENMDGLEKGLYWIQVKKKDLGINKKDIEEHKSHYDRILIHLGETNISDRILGVDWLSETIDIRQDILNWLKSMTFKYDMFDFIWESSNQ